MSYTYPLRKKSIFVLLFIILLSVNSCAQSGNEYYVSEKGNDNNPGTLRKPFLTIQKAAEILQPGDICYVREGTYRETVRPARSGEPDKPIQFNTYRDEKVILDGTEPVSGKWELFNGNIYKIKVDSLFEQLFSDGIMMLEARWPNMSFPDQLWDRSCWAKSGKGSIYGIMVDEELSKSGIDWTGALAVLNVAHQFVTWTRVVKSHGAGNNSFTYEKDLQPITSYADKTRQWEDDVYYLTGKLEALDIPGEWYLDRENKELYFLAPDGKNPGEKEVSFKFRDYAFDITDKEHIRLSGFEFFGNAVKLSNVNHSLVENCSFTYPTFSREFMDPSAKKLQAETVIIGNNNIFRRNHIAFSQMSGLMVRGAGNIIDNNIIHDVAWNGQGFAIQLLANGDGNIISRNTAYNTGYSVIQPSGSGKYEVKYNHFHHAALVSKDCAIIQTGNPEITGSVIHHNWVHDCFATGDHPGGLKGGLGIRGDDQTRGLTVHHNVVWNCGRDGIIVKGDSNRVFHNTVFNIGSNNLEGNYISLHTEPEPYKPWRKQAPLLEIQNLNSIVINNAAFNIVGDRERNPFTPTENMIANYLGKDLKLKDPIHSDFSPIPGSPLIDAGIVIQGFTENYQGKNPDIGAYEYGDTYWKPGADWQLSNK